MDDRKSGGRIIFGFGFHRKGIVAMEGRTKLIFRINLLLEMNWGTE
jgi:hypothetical protein